MVSVHSRPFPAPKAPPGPERSGRGVTAVLGPTNTGKTHLAIERMLGHESGIIGLPLRLLAREVYQRLVARAGTEAVALITGEEKIKPKNPRYWVSTVEAMPRDLDASFVAIDEIQLIADADRGHVFTDALLHRRGRHETMLMGSQTARPVIEALLPGVQVQTRPRLSTLSFAGEKKITRLPPRSAIIAFSAEEVYAIAELVRRHRGGAAVVMGSLSPRTRNAQVEMFQAGEVDHIVATDAIGMGLNLEIGHVAFASSRKFDGSRHRTLYPAELAQVAGRAGRAAEDGTFGSTGRCPPFDEETIEAIESHVFDPLKVAQWRNSALDFSTLGRLDASLERAPGHPALVRAARAEDEMTLSILTGRPHIRDLAASGGDIRRLWELCQLPDYRKVSPQLHADLVATLFEAIQRKGVIDPDWFGREVKACDRTEGDIDALAWRLANIRTWSYCANRSDWLADPLHWQNVTRKLEDRVSDALHERLMQRFVDRRTSVLMRRLKENVMLEAQVSPTGDVVVEGQHIGRLEGFRFTPDPGADGAEAKALRAAAAKALASELETRATRLSTAGDEQFTLSLDGVVRYLGEPIASLQAGARPLEPRCLLLADETLQGLHREMAETRVSTWLKAHVQKHLGALFALETGEGLSGIARGIAYRLAEALGVLDRAVVAQDVRGLDQQARGDLRKLGIRFGAYHLFIPALMKPGPRSLAAQLFLLAKGADGEAAGGDGLRDVSHLAFSGRTSIPVDANIPAELYRVAGFRVAGPRALRVDILERLADLIRPAITYRPGQSDGLPPAGAADGDGFVVTGAMTSLVGCAGAEFGEILKALGYKSETRKGPAITVALKPMAAMMPISIASVPAPVVGEDMAPVESQADAEVVADAAVMDESVDAAPDAPVTEGVETPEVLAETSVTADAVTETPVSPEAEPVEPVDIEVWRVSRAERGQRPPRHDGARQDRRPRGDNAGGRPQFRHGRKPDAQPQGAAGAPEGTAQGQPREERGRHEKRERFEKFGQKPREDRGPRRDGRPEGGRPDGKPDFRGGHKGGKPPQRDFAPAKPPREKEPDPDSPFAKLLALKQQMQGKE